MFIYRPEIIILLLIRLKHILCFTLLSDEKSQNKPTNNNNQMIYAIPKEGSKVVFRCFDTKNEILQQKVQMWILPDGEQVAIIPSKMKRDENGTLAIWERNGSIKFTQVKFNLKFLFELEMGNF